MRPTCPGPATFVLSDYHIALNGRTKFVVDCGIYRLRAPCPVKIRIRHFIISATRHELTEYRHRKIMWADIFRPWSSTKFAEDLSPAAIWKRPYLGPTSMDNELSMVMANMALVRVGSIVLDPFAGTGSILLACSNFGAFCLNWYRRSGASWQGWKQCKYKLWRIWLVRPELVRCDSSMYLRHSSRCFYDAIVCDPPYGIELARGSWSRQGRNRLQILPERRATHIPQTQPYPVEDVLVDLLDLAAKICRRWAPCIFAPNNLRFYRRRPSLSSMFACSRK